MIGWKDLVLGRETPYDDTMHGTLVSSVLAGSGAGGAEGRGVAPAAKLVGVKVIDQIGMSSLSLIAQGIQWVVENRAHVRDRRDEPLDRRSGRLWRRDRRRVAGGRRGGGRRDRRRGRGGQRRPGELHCQVARRGGVGADGRRDGRHGRRRVLARPSSRVGARPPTAGSSPTSPPRASTCRWPSPAAGYVASSGTSVAAPFTTGTALLMLQANPALTPAQVKQTIMNTAVDWGRPGKDIEYGAGRLDVYAALRAVGAPLAVPPAAPDHRTWSGTLAEGQVATSDVEIADPRFPLAVTMLGPGSGFDLSLRDAGGASVGTMTTQFGPSRQEDITLNAPAPGHYTVRVEARADAGEFVTDISAALAPADSEAPGLTLAELPAATNDDTPDATGARRHRARRLPRGRGAGLRDGQMVRRLAATPLLGQWSVMSRHRSIRATTPSRSSRGRRRQRHASLAGVQRRHHGPARAGDRGDERRAEQPNGEAVGDGRAGAKVSISEGPSDARRRDGGCRRLLGVRGQRTSPTARTTIRSRPPTRPATCRRRRR